MGTNYQDVIYNGDKLLRHYLQWGQIIKTLFTMGTNLLRRYLQWGQIIKTLLKWGQCIKKLFTIRDK